MAHFIHGVTLKTFMRSHMLIIIDIFTHKSKKQRFLMEIDYVIIRKM